MTVYHARRQQVIYENIIGFILGYRGNISCKTVLHLDKFSPYATDKELERRFHDITNDYDKSPPPTATASPIYPSLNGILFDSGVGVGSLQSDLNGNTKNLVNNSMNLGAMSLGNSQHSGTDPLGNLNRTATSLNGSGLLTNITGSHNNAGNIQLDRKFLQFTTDQVNLN